jgi:hypothetical protein
LNTPGFTAETRRRREKPTLISKENLCAPSVLGVYPLGLPRRRRDAEKNPHSFQKKSPCAPSVLGFYPRVYRGDAETQRRRENPTHTSKENLCALCLLYPKDETASLFISAFLVFSSASLRLCGEQILIQENIT